jgi:hypothetical protein
MPIRRTGNPEKIYKEDRVFDCLNLMMKTLRSSETALCTSRLGAKRQRLEPAVTISVRKSKLAVIRNVVLPKKVDISSKKKNVCGSGVMCPVFLTFST